ncbi:MAG: type I 3-dehydroquinate dehydratase [Candidatus Acidiferrales bacterium]
MKRRISSPLRVRNLEFGAEQPLFCIPIVPRNLRELAAQAEIAHKLKPELIEWRADFFSSPTTTSLIEAARLIRETAPTQPIIFTLRAKNEGGAQGIPQSDRRVLIEAVLRSSTIDIVDLELANDEEFLHYLMQIAGQCGIPVILAFHDFERTRDDDFLLSKIESMRSHGACIAKIAVMPQSHEDVLRLLLVTARARTLYPSLPLITMAMGTLGSVTRTAGFLFGSDMSFALGQSGSAPGQIPIEDARKITEMLLRYS